MVLSVVSAAVDFRTLARSVDVEVLPGDECALLVEEFARVEKTCAAVRAMAAARAAACGAHRTRGFFGAEDWMAGVTGSSRQQAKSELETGARLGDCPETKDAAVGGDLSLGQAGDIARTEGEKPGSEGDLIAKAKTSSRQELADACRKRRQEGVDRDELAAKQHALRKMRSWTDGDGMICGQFRLEPSVGVPLLKRLADEADRLHRAARAEGSTEPWEAHAADALAAMLGADAGAAGGGVGVARRTKTKTKAEVVFVIDLRTFRTGTHDDTVCHIVGGGPVPPDIVRTMAKDAFLKAVFHDGVTIHTVSHLGRYIPAELRTALELGEPPDFDGIRCSGCGKRFRLQWDHVDPVCAGGLTTYDNQDPKCWDCHTRKSAAERAAGVYDRAPSPAIGRGRKGRTDDGRARPADRGRPKQ